MIQGNGEVFLSGQAPLLTQMIKNLPAMQETRVRSLDQEDSLKKGMATHSCLENDNLEFLPGKLHGQRSLVGYSPWGLSDMTEKLTILAGHRKGIKQLRNRNLKR